MGRNWGNRTFLCTFSFHVGRCMNTWVRFFTCAVQFENSSTDTGKTFHLNWVEFNLSFQRNSSNAVLRKFTLDKIKACHANGGKVQPKIQYCVPTCRWQIGSSASRIGTQGAVADNPMGRAAEHPTPWCLSHVNCINHGINWWRVMIEFIMGRRYDAGRTRTVRCNYGFAAKDVLAHKRASGIARPIEQS